MGRQGVPKITRHRQRQVHMTTQIASRAPKAARQVEFPIIESFTSGHTANPHWKLKGSAALNGSLELTPNQKSKAGTAFLDQAFSSKLGVTIDFDFAVTGGIDPAFGLGDGFCVYLIDGQYTTEPGGLGAGLGYAMERNITPHQPGVTGGYVGVGFDNFGNFASGLAGPDGPGRRSNMLGVRGSGSGTEGFRWLTGVQAPNGFRADWKAGAHLQISVVDGRLTVRRSSAADPNGTLLLDDYPLTDQPGQQQMPPTFKLGFSAGTGAATASHQIRNLKVALPVHMSLDMEGPVQADAGQRIHYLVNVSNSGPNDAPDALVEGTIPIQLSDVRVECTAKDGAVCGPASTSDGLHQPVDLPVDRSAQIVLSGRIDPAYEGPMTCAALISSPTRANAALQHHDSIRTQVTIPPANVDQEIAGQWQQTWPEDAVGYVVSSNLKMRANQDRVVEWEIRFDVPEGTRVNPVQRQWYQVKEDGQNGSVVLASPGDGKHTIEPGAGLTVQVQMLYPSKAVAGTGELRNLRVAEVTGG
jgi:uncharacterized repeat protein (TIGR01451 family)